MPRRKKLKRGWLQESPAEKGETPREGEAQEGRVACSGLNNLGTRTDTRGEQGPEVESASTGAATLIAVCTERPALEGRGGLTVGAAKPEADEPQEGTGIRKDARLREWKEP